MPRHSRVAIFLRVGLLPLVLIAAAVAGLGSYCEASDDLALAWLFSGIIALKPVASLPLYFHGLGHLLAGLYTAAPGVAWFGYLLGALLAGATVLTFAVLDKLLRPHLPPAALTLALVAFFALAWLEHWLWFSYVRVALLLAAAALLFAAQRPGRLGPLLVGLAGLLLAWLMRPSQATMGLAAALPGVLWLAGSLRRARPLLLSATLLLALATGLHARLETPFEAHLRQRDTQLARILDFELLRPVPHTPADSLGTAAIDQWLLGDTGLIDPVLAKGVYRFKGGEFLARTLPAKLGLRLGLLGRDYFPLLLALLATAAAGGRRPLARPRWFWLVQAGFGGGLLLLAGLAKLPPRLAMPLLDLWLLNNLIFLFKPASAENQPIGEAPHRQPAALPVRPRMRWAATAFCLLIGIAYGLKTAHRCQVLRQEQHEHQTSLAALRRLAPGAVRVLAGTNFLLKSLSPFRVADPGFGPVLQLTGWPAQDASQADLRRYLSGAAGQPQCLVRLAQPPAPGQTRPIVWVLSRPAARWLRRCRAADLPPLSVTDLGPLAGTADAELRRYRVQAAQKP